jgi:hypothetical protein
MQESRRLAFHGETAFSKRKKRAAAVPPVAAAGRDCR